MEYPSTKRARSRTWETTDLLTDLSTKESHGADHPECHDAAHAGQCQS